MKSRTPWGQIFPQLNFANCIENRVSFFPLKHRVFYFSDSPHSEPGTIDEVDHDNGTEPHTSDDGKHRQQQQRVGSVLEELCVQGSTVPLMALNWTGVPQH